MTTTPSTASQAPVVSICPMKAAGLPAEEAEAFIAAMTKWRFSRPGQDAIEKFDAVVAIIDAKLAQARQETFGSHPELLQLREQNQFMLDERDSLITRATAAEAKLEAIRQGVRECVGFGFDKDGPNWISRQQVLSLLQPQTKAAKEAEQRQRMQERFANRPKTPATADFDLPYASNSDGPDYSQADESGLPG